MLLSHASIQSALEALTLSWSLYRQRRLTDGGPLWGCQSSPSCRLVSTVYALSVLLYNLLITPIHERHGCIGCKLNLASRGMARRDRGRLCLDTGGTDNEERDAQPIRACGSPASSLCFFPLKPRKEMQGDFRLIAWRGRPQGLPRPVEETPKVAL